MAEVSPLPDDVLELGKTLIPRPVFLIGCARSGTSILGEALAAHPSVAYLFEASRIWNELVPPRPDHRLVAADATREVALEIYRALAEAHEEVRAAAGDATRGAHPEGIPPRGVRREAVTGQGAAAGGAAGKARIADDTLLEKNPKHVIRIPFLDALFPHARFVHIIRDGRDTTASLMFRNRGDRWGHLEIPGWRDLLAAYPKANHIRCAHQWRDSVRLARADAAGLGPGRYLEVRYEDLLRDPSRIAGGLLEFLGLAPHPSVDAFLPKIQDATAGSYHARRQVRHYVENHSRRMGRYRENLTPVECRDVEAVCGDLLRELGYGEPAVETPE